MFFRLLPSAALLVLGASGPARADYRKPPSVSRSGPAVIYDGYINDGGVRRLGEVLREEGIREMRITSRGGEAVAGIKIGTLVFDKALDVIVTSACLSACANYVFTAGLRKEILPGAMVAWHGSAIQKNFRERHAGTEARIKIFGIESLSAAERGSFERHRELVLKQRDFFERVGVNEYVTRVGQEPFFHGISWTISIPDMEKFGIRNVQGPPRYGWPSYCSDWVLSRRTPVKCLRVTPEMVEFMQRQT